MSEQEYDFSPELVDQQVEQPSTLHSIEAKHLLQDVQQGYRSYTEQNDRSLERVWQRLEQYGDAPHTKTPLVFPDQSTHRHASNVSIKTFVGSSRRSRAQRALGLLSVAAVVALLLGSTMLVLYYAHSTTKKSQDIVKAPSTPTIGITTENDITTFSLGTVSIRQDTTTSKGIYISSDVSPILDQISKLDSTTHQVIWSYPVGGSPTYTVQNDTVYVSASDVQEDSAKYLYAINASTGTLRWKFTFSPDLQKTSIKDPITGKSFVQADDLGFLTTPVESQGVVYVLSRSGKLFAIRATDGKAVWMTKVDASAFVNGTIYDPLPVSVSNGVVYGGIHNLLFALDVETGKQVWTARIDDGYVFNQTYVVNSSLYVSASHVSAHTGGSFNNPSAAFAFDAKGGKKLWQQHFNSWLISSPTVVNSTVYVGTFDGNLYALTSSNGSEIWKLPLYGRADLQPVIVSNGVIYAEEDGTATPTTTDSISAAVIAVTIHGTKLWQVQAESVQTSIHMQVVANSVLYISQYPRQIRAYNAKLGNELWHQAYGVDYLDKMGSHAGSTPSVVVVL